MTKIAKSREIQFCEQYDSSNARELYQVYTSYSASKEKAYNSCIDKYLHENGFDLRIISHNSNFFTVAWKYEDILTGVIKLCVETAYNTYRFDYIPASLR